MNSKSTLSTSPFMENAQRKRATFNSHELQWNTTAIMQTMFHFEHHIVLNAECRSFLCTYKVATMQTTPKRLHFD